MWGVGKRSTVLRPGPSPSVSPGPWAVNSLLPTGGRTGRREWAGVGCPLSPGQSGPQQVGAWGPRFSRGQTSLGRTEFSGVFQKKKTIRPHGKTHTNVGEPWSVGRSDLSVCPLQLSVSYSGGFPSWTPAPVALSAGDCLLWGAATPCLASLSLSAEGEGGGLPCVTASLADPGRKPLLFQSVRTAC